MKKNLITTLVILMMVLINSCMTNTDKELSKDTKDSVQVAKERVTEIPSYDFEDYYDSINKSIPVFYNMNLTVELSSMFETLGATFNPDLVNPSGNKDNYLRNYQKALNIGVYAVDFIYSRIYEKQEYITGYLDAMQELSSQIRIPGHFVQDVVDRIERNKSNHDSLNVIANEIYSSTMSYLKENNRPQDATLILSGGWVEAMYVATSIYINEGHDILILDKIVDQKHSLETIMQELNQYNNIAEIQEMLQEFNQLKLTMEVLHVDYNNPYEIPHEFEAFHNQIVKMRSGIIQ